MKKRAMAFWETSAYGVATLAAVVLLWRMELLVVGIVAGIAVAMIARGERRDMVIYGACAILGPVAEMIVIYSGAWEYAAASILGVPIWLPFVWGNAALYIVRMDRAIKEGN